MVGAVESDIEPAKYKTNIHEICDRDRREQKGCVGPVAPPIAWRTSKDAVLDSLVRGILAGRCFRIAEKSKESGRKRSAFKPSTVSAVSEV